MRSEKSLESSWWQSSSESRAPKIMQELGGEMKHDQLADMPPLELASDQPTELQRQRDFLTEKTLDYRRRKQRCQEQNPDKYRQHLIWRDALAKQLLADELLRQNEIDPQKVFNALQDLLPDYDAAEFEDAYIVIGDYIASGGQNTDAAEKIESGTGFPERITAQEKKLFQQWQEINQQLVDQEEKIKLNKELYHWRSRTVADEEEPLPLQQKELVKLRAKRESTRRDLWALIRRRQKE